MKTRAEVEELKRQWVNDPNWDLGADEGFEEYLDELVKFQLEQEVKWYQERAQRLHNKSVALGVPGNTKLAEAWELMEYKLDELRSELNRFVNHD